MLPRFRVHAYIRNNEGALVESVDLDVCAISKESAHSLVRLYYEKQNLTAGINPEATVEMKDFSVMLARLLLC